MTNMEPLPWYRFAAPIVFVVMLSGVCLWRNMPRFRAMLLGIVLLSGYAMLQDQVSARLCPEYFTVLHNPINGLTNPTLLGITWGFLGSWWGGALLGYGAGLASTLGRNPPMTVKQLLKPMLCVIAFVTACTAFTGISVAMNADGFSISINVLSIEAIPIQRRTMAFIVATYHLVAYASSVVGSVVCIVWIANNRAKLGVV
jgi:hypothetical protein